MGLAGWCLSWVKAKFGPGVGGDSAAYTWRQGKESVFSALLSLRGILTNKEVTCRSESKATRASLAGKNTTSGSGVVRLSCICFHRAGILSDGYY